MCFKDSRHALCVYRTASVHYVFIGQCALCVYTAAEPACSMYLQNSRRALCVYRTAWRALCVYRTASVHYVFIGERVLCVYRTACTMCLYGSRRALSVTERQTELFSWIKTWMAPNQTEVYILTFQKEDTSSHPLTTKDNESSGFAEKLNVFKKTSSLLVGLRIHAHFYPIM